MIILPCMKRPDLDAIGGSLAYAEYLRRHEGKQVKVWISDTPDGEARFHLEKFQPENLATIEEVKAADEYQLVDLSRPEALPDFIDFEKVTRVIDHRFLHDVDTAFPNAVIELEPVGAAATQVAEYFMRASLVPGMESACMLYGAIYSNTLCLKGDITTDRDREAAAWLTQNVPGCDQYCDAQLAARKKDLVDNLKENIADERKDFSLSTGPYGFTQFEMLEGQEFWNDNKDVICATLKTMPERSLFTIIDLTRNITLAYTEDSNLQERMTKEFKLEFADNMIILDPALMRKQIAKMLEDKPH